MSEPAGEGSSVGMKTGRGNIVPGGRGVACRGINRRGINRRGVERRGAAAIEMALVLMIFIMMVFGIVEFSRAMMVNQVLTNAAREGARRAVIPGATQSQVTSRIGNYMSSAGMNTYATEIKVNGTVADLSTATHHSLVSVRVSVVYSDVDWGGIGLLGQNRTFSATVQMRKE